MLCMIKMSWGVLIHYVLAVVCKMVHQRVCNYLFKCVPALRGRNTASFTSVHWFFSAAWQLIKFSADLQNINRIRPKTHWRRNAFKYRPLTSKDTREIRTPKISEIIYSSAVSNSTDIQICVFPSCSPNS